MTNKEENIKSRLKLLIDNIDEFGHKFVTYKAKTIKALLQSTLQFIKAKEQECEGLKSENFTFEELIKKQEEQLDDDNVIIERFLIASGKSKDITEPEEFEEVFQDIEQTYSEHEELNKECEELRGRLNTICFDSRANNNRCISYNRMAEDYEKDLKKLTKYETLFLKAREISQRISKYNQQLIDENEDLKDTIKRFTCQSECYKHKDAEKYKQALDEIENYVRDNSDFDKSDKLTSNTGAYDILEIINKAKE